MYVKEKIKTLFLTLLEDKDLAMLYFYNRDIVDEFKSDKLLELENKLKKSESKYNKVINLIYVADYLGIEYLVKKINSNLDKIDKDYSKNIKQLDIFKSSLAYLIISGILNLENLQVMGYSKEFIEEFLISYQNQINNPYNEYYYNENNGRTSRIEETGRRVILPYTPHSVIEKINKKESELYASVGVSSLKKLNKR